MKNVFKTLTITVVTMFLVVLIPTTVQAKTKVMNFNIDKVSANDFVTEVQTQGKIAHFSEKDKNKYKITLTVKAKSEKDGVKKVESFAKKVMKADSNKYGLSYGIKPDEYTHEKYDAKKKIYTVKLANTANDLYYLNCITRDALNTKYIESSGNSLTTKAIFPDSKSFKKASESVKVQTICSYMGSHCMYGISGKIAFTWKRAYEGKCQGMCGEFLDMYIRAIRLIAYDYKYQIEVNTKVNHGLVIVKVKNSDDSYDYFQGNNSGFNPYIVLDTKVTKDKNAATYLFFDSWQVSEPKLYRVTKFEKAAYKWGKAKKSSDLEKMYMNR